MWEAKKKDHTLSTQACTPSPQCGHYTQVVWAKSAHVGCACQSCPSLSYPNKKHNGIAKLPRRSTYFA